MASTFRKALEAATGRSEFIFVVFADIRGFSSFSMRHEAPDVAMYIKRVYMRLIDDFFPFASFYKATGDGLLMTVPYKESNVQNKARATVGACFKALKAFPNICAGDSMINFPAPDKIGFGVSRGTACCLVSGRTVLDYSGHLLNLTARLMDLARPSGIVLDGVFGMELLTPATQSKFDSDDVYIRSVAEDKTRQVFFQKGVVELSLDAHRPIRVELWETVEQKGTPKTVKEWKEVAPRFRIDLPNRLKRPDLVRVELLSKLIRGSRVVSGKFVSTSFEDLSHIEIQNKDHIVLDVEKILSQAKTRKLRQKDMLEVSVSYVPR